MNNTKKINVNFSSLVGLKAELLRKQIEVNDAKAKVDPATLNLPKVKIKNKKNNSIKQEKEKPEKVTEIEDVNMLKKSKCMLQAKSMLYDKLKKNHGGNDHHYLVDFENKSDESEDEFHREEDYEDTNSDPEEDWVEYQDCFGRTRKCLRRDLPRMKDKDNLIKKEIVKDPPEESENQRVEKPIFIQPEKEPEIEIMRKKWEEQTEKLTQKSDIHYQDLLFDEARAHGVGYFAFSQDETERAKQQANLAKLRKETEQRQKELQEIKELKKRMEENRLKAARVRQRIRAGLPPELDDNENIGNNSEPSADESNKNVDEVVQPVPSEINDPDENSEKSEKSLAVIEDKIKAFGELLGKRPKWRELSQEEWVEKRRKDRHGEFAPVYDNFKSAGFLRLAMENKNYQLIAKESDNNDPLRIPGNGPDPWLWESSGSTSCEQNNSVQEKVDESTKEEVKHADQLIPTMDQTIEPKISQSIEMPQIPSTNFPEVSLPVFPVPPPLFDASIPPPSIISSLPLLPIVHSVPPFVNSNYITAQDSLYSVPFPHSGAPIIDQSFLNQSTSISNATSTESALNSENNEENLAHVKESSSESDSDDSDIIGPMPPASIIKSDDVSKIPLPCYRDITESLNKKVEDEKQQKNLNIDKIAEGLKFLRQQFDNVHRS